MKPFKSAVVALLAMIAFAAAEEPSVSIYQIIPQDYYEGPELAEVILKLNNPTYKPLYTFGQYLADVQHTLQVLKDGKWSDYPSEGGCAGVNPAYRAILPGTYITFNVFPLPVVLDDDPDLVCRVRAVIHTERRSHTDTTKPARQTWIELFSPTFSTKDLRSKKSLPPIPAISGLKPIPKSK
jgi:hypothetical protein